MQTDIPFRSHPNHLKWSFLRLICSQIFGLKIKIKLLLRGSSIVTYLFYCKRETADSFGTLLTVGVVALTYLLLLISLGRFSSFDRFAFRSPLLPIRWFDLLTVFSQFFISSCFLINLDFSFSSRIMNSSVYFRLLLL